MAEFVESAVYAVIFGVLVALPMIVINELRLWRKGHRHD